MLIFIIGISVGFLIMLLPFIKSMIDMLIKGKPIKLCKGEKGLLNSCECGHYKIKHSRTGICKVDSCHCLVFDDSLADF